MRTPAWCRAQAALIGPACDALVGELLAVNALFRLRQAQRVLRLGQRHGDARLEAACARALEAGDPSYRTVKGILAAGTERDAIQLPLPGVAEPAWLHGPGAFAGECERLGRPGRSLILTSNRSPSDWYPLFPNAVVGESILDRHQHQPPPAPGRQELPARRRPGRTGPVPAKPAP
jgi:hypothetical protein